jgi:hypothetical protein
MHTLPVPVAARSNAWVCGRSLSGIVGSNSCGDMDYFPCDCCVLSGRDLARGRYLVQNSPTDYVCLWSGAKMSR